MQRQVDVLWPRLVDSERTRWQPAFPLQRIAAAVQNRDDSGAAASDPNIIASN